MRRHALVVRLDGMGDVLVCGPAIRAVAATVDRVTVLAGPAGAEAARLLPGVSEVIQFAAPWVLADPPPVQLASFAELIERVRSSEVNEALVLTSFHQSALPTALALRLAGVTRIAAISTDYPGSLLDVRVAEPADEPEPLRMLTVAQDAGYDLPDGDDARLGVRSVDPSPILGRYVVIHPGADAPSRALPPELTTQLLRRLGRGGVVPVITGGAGETKANAALAAADPATLDLTGRLVLPELAAVLSGARAVICGNTGPAHLAAAVGTPVVSVFAPVVPAARWAPYGRSAVLGDQYAACRDSRARVCPVAGHPCVSNLSPDDVLEALCRVTSSEPVGATP